MIIPSLPSPPSKTWREEFIAYERTSQSSNIKPLKQCATSYITNFSWLDTWITLKYPKLIQPNLFEMNQQQTYRGQVLMLGGWEVHFVCDNSLFSQKHPSRKDEEIHPSSHHLFHPPHAGGKGSLSVFSVCLSVCCSCSCSWSYGHLSPSQLPPLTHRLLSTSTSTSTSLSLDVHASRFVLPHIATNATSFPSLAVTAYRLITTPPISQRRSQSSNRNPKRQVICVASQCLDAFVHVTWMEALWQDWVKCVSSLGLGFSDGRCLWVSEVETWGGWG